MRLCLGLTVGLSAGCARVEPSADYDRTMQMTRERTGVEDVYDPRAEAMVEERVSAMLADGLTADEAVRITLLKNSGFQALFGVVGASRADVVQSALLTNPSFSFSARFPEGGGRSDLPFGLGQELVDLWQIPVRKQVAEAQLEQAVLEVVRLGLDLSTEARRRYYQLAALERAVDIAHENLRLAEQSLKLAERRQSAGETGQLDVNLLRANVLAVQTTLIGLARDREVAKAALARTLGLARWAESWRLAASAQTPLASPPDEEALIVLAMRERPEARIAAQRVRAAEQELRRQCLNVFPHMEIGLDGERPESGALPGRNILADTTRASIRQGQLTAPDIQSRGERNIERRQIIDLVLGPSIQMTLPVWDQNQAGIAKAAYQAEQSRKEYEDLLDDVVQQVREAAATARAAAELSRFFDEQVMPQAEANLELARKSYEAGEQGIVTLIEAQEALISERLATVNIHRDYRIAVAELQRSVGGRLPAESQTAPTATQPSGEPSGGI
jgi:cobalt-zinc-cadmium efflux system outer membrane protein